MKLTAFALILFSQLALAAEIAVVSQWTIPRSGKRPGETTEERTKPILVGDILYTAGLSGYVSAIHRTDGYVLWQKKLEGAVEGCLGYGRSKIVVGDLQGNLYALNARDGSEAWRFKIQSEWVAPPAIVRDKVYAASSSEELFVFNEATGKEVWHYGHRGDEKMTVRGVSGTIVYGSDVFQGFADGSLVALSSSNGKVLWTKRLKSRERFYDVDATPYVDDKNVLAATFDGKIYNLERTTGNTIWIHAVGSYGGFLVEGDKVFFAGLDGNFYALNMQTSTVIWKTPYEGRVGLQPVRSGEQIVFTTANDPSYALDADTGRILWKGSFGQGTLSAPAGSPDGWFYVLSNFGNLFSYSIISGVTPKLSPVTVPPHSAIGKDFASKRNQKDS